MGQFLGCRQTIQNRRARCALMIFSEAEEIGGVVLLILRNNRSVAIPANLLLPGRGEALQVLEPVHYKDHLGHRRGLRFLNLHHQKPLTI